MDHLNDGYCLYCGPCQVDTSGYYEDAWTCASDNECPAKDPHGKRRQPLVFLESDREAFDEARTQLIAGRYDHLLKMVREVTEYAQAGAVVPARWIDAVCRLDNCEDRDEMRARGAIGRMVRAVADAARPAARRSKRAAIGGAA